MFSSSFSSIPADTLCPSTILVCSPSIKVMENIKLAERQKTMPDYETGVKVISLKYLIDINVKTRSFMFETLAFSKGDIFIDIILPKFSLWYLCIPEQLGGWMCRAGPSRRMDSAISWNSWRFPHILSRISGGWSSMADLGWNLPPSGLTLLIYQLPPG